MAQSNTEKADIEITMNKLTATVSKMTYTQNQSTASTCRFYTSPMGCAKGKLCQYKHIGPNQKVVCKYWLQGLCTKGNQCEYLHKNDKSKIPECHFYSNFKVCNNKNCAFLHKKPETKQKECVEYNKGFCKRGPYCRYKHVRRVMCRNYILGSCMNGPNCKDKHVDLNVPAPTEQNVSNIKENPVITCQLCGESGHEAPSCFKVTINRMPNVPSKDYRNIEDVTCFKCGAKGHYANRCPNRFIGF